MEGLSGHQVLFSPQIISPGSEGRVWFCQAVCLLSHSKEGKAKPQKGPRVAAKAWLGWKVGDRDSLDCSRLRPWQSRDRSRDNGREAHWDSQPALITFP